MKQYFIGSYPTLTAACPSSCAVVSHHNLLQKQKTIFGASVSIIVQQEEVTRHFLPYWYFVPGRQVESGDGGSSVLSSQTSAAAAAAAARLALRSYLIMWMCWLLCALCSSAQALCVLPSGAQWTSLTHRGLSGRSDASPEVGSEHNRTLFRGLHLT